MEPCSKFAYRLFAYQRDVFEFMDLLKDGSLAGCITDLPYPTTERHRARGTTTRTKASGSSSNPWYGVMTIDALCRFMEVLYRKLRKNAYAFIYVDDSTYLLLASKLGMIDDLAKLSMPGVSTSRAPKDRIGFSWWNPATWGKVTADSMPMLEWSVHSGVSIPNKWREHHVVKLRPGTGYHGAATTERILILEKGKSQLRERFVNLQLAARPPAKPRGAEHRAASPKPIDVAERLVRAMAEPGEVVCDPFVGGGTHAVGIVNAGCVAVVNDADLTTAKDHWANVHGLEFIEK